MSIYSDAVLILKPSGYKAAELYSVVPNTSVGDFDVARSSTTTRINASGYIEQVAANVPRLNYDSGDSCPYLLTESASTNLITYPISFGNSYWTKSGASIEGDESNLTTAVYTSDFSSDNDSFVYNRLTANANVTIDGVDDALRVTLFSGDGTHNMYSDRTKEGFSFLNSSDSDLYSVSFDVYIPSSNAKVDGIRFSYGGDYTPLTDTWTTYNVVVNPDLTYFYFFALDGAATAIDSDGDMFYIKNITFKQVQGFDAPKVDGNGGFEKEAYKLVESSGDERHFINTISTAGTNTASIFVKAGERYKIGLRENSVTGHYASFNLTTGAIIETNGTTANITAMADSWYRISFTTVNGGGSWGYGVELLPDSYTTGDPYTASYTGDGSSGLYIAYAQLEESDYASSLMLPTTEGSTTSRVADAVTGGGNQSLFSNVNSNGVLYAEIAINSGDNVTGISIFGDAANAIKFYNATTATDLTVRVRVDGTYVYTQTQIGLTLTDYNKIAIRFNNDYVSLWLNGTEYKKVAPTADLDFTTALNTLNLADVGSNPFYGKTRALAVFDYLSDAEMVTLTT